MTAPNLFHNLNKQKKMKTKRLLMTSLATVVMLLAAIGVHADTAFYVSPIGNNSGDGSKAHPWKTLPYAITQIGNHMQSHQESVTLRLMAGEYLVASPVQISGKRITQPLTIEADGGAQPVITSAIHAIAWKKISDKRALNILPASARKHVLVTDLKKSGITDYGSFATLDNHVDLYLNGKRQEVARWPNGGGFTHIAEVNGTTIDDKGVSKEGVFTYSDKRMDKWADDSNAYLYGYWRWDWSEEYQKIASIDKRQRRITLAGTPHTYGYKAGARYQGVNVLCELDSVGEYYVDAKNELLYWYAPDSFNAQKDEAIITAYKLAYQLVITGCNDLTLRNLTFTGNRGGALNVKDGQGLTVDGCHFSQYGATVFYVKGHKDLQLHNSTFQEMGCGGVSLYVGDRKTLTNSDCVVKDCTFERFSLFKHTYQPAIFFSGCGLLISHNLFCHCPSSAMRLEGNNFTVEYNRLTDLVTESDDQGGIDMFYNVSYRGNVIRYNWWEDITGGTLCSAAAVRFDDMISGTRVYGNVFVNCGAVNFGAVQIHGGKDNVVENNLYYDCNAAVSFSPWQEQRWKDELVKCKDLYTVYVDINSKAYRKAYPELKESLASHPNRNYVRNNLLVNCAHAYLRDKSANVMSNNQAITDVAHDVKWFLQSNVLKKYGLQPIPFEKIRQVE